MTAARDGVAVRGASRVRLHDLRIRAEGEQWYVGRVDIGVFVVLPEIGVRALHLLRSGSTVDDVGAELAGDGGDGVDVVDFVESLIGLGFVAAIDETTVPSPNPPRNTLPWLRARHVRWMLHPGTAIGTLALILAGLATVVLSPDLMPSYRDAIVSSNGTLVLLVNAAIGWGVLLVHELAHLATARAADVPGTMSFGTRLQFLVAQTDVSGIWSAPRRIRLTVYCAGLAIQLALAAAGLLFLALARPAGAVHGVVSVLVLLAIATVPWQALVFMRTDLYFVLQDLSRCPNLYEAGSAYVRYLLRRLAWWSRARTTADPSAGLETGERRTVRLYAILLVIGTVGCLAVYAAITLPILITLVVEAIGRLTHAGTAASAIDAATVLLLIALVQGLWARSWWRKHRHRFRRRRPSVL